MLQETANNLVMLIQAICELANIDLKNVETTSLMLRENVSESGLLVEFNGCQNSSKKKFVDAQCKDANGRDVGVVVHYAEEADGEGMLTGVEVFPQEEGRKLSFPLDIDAVQIF